MSKQKFLERLWQGCTLLLKHKDEYFTSNYLYRKFIEFHNKHTPISWANTPYPSPSRHEVSRDSIISAIKQLPIEIIEHFYETILVECSDPKHCNLTGRFPVISNFLSGNRQYELRDI